MFLFPSLPSSSSRSPLSQISLATLAFLTYTNRSEMYKLRFCLYKAWENCIYTCKYIYFRPIHLYLYNKNTPLPSFFCLSLFLVLYKFKLYLISLFLVLYNSIQLYIHRQVSFVFLFSHFIQIHIVYNHSIHL